MVAEPTLSPRGERIQQHLRGHIAARLQAVQLRYQGRTDTAARDALKAAQEKYQLASILEKGAKAAKGIAIASHIAKATHPDLKVKDVSNLAVDFSALPKLAELGSHVVPTGKSWWDATGDGAYNNAAYELYLLLDTLFEGQTLASWLEAGDSDAVAALAASADVAGSPWLDLLASKCPTPAVSSLSKQLYWLPAGGNPCDDRAYVLLAPLSSAPLMHLAYLQIHADRFGETNKAAREAKKERKHHDGVFHDYPHLAVQNMGGTKPQNISQLNSERRGVNYLLSCLPPQWQASENRLPVHTDSVFQRYFDHRPLVRQTVQALRRFLETDPPANRETRKQRQAMVDTLVDDMVAMAAELAQALPPGWTASDERFERLNEDEQCWLDPLRAQLPEEAAFAQRWLALDWPEAIGRRFGNWLNARLEGKLHLGDVEFAAWKTELLADEDGFSQQLREQRSRIRAARKNHQEAAV